MAPQYHLTEFGVNSASIPASYLACNKLGLIKRPFLAADLHLDVKHPTALTQIQAAMLARVNRTYVHYAVKRMAERAEIEAGLVPLVPPPHMAPKTNSTALTTESGIVDSGLVQFVRSVGINRVLEAAIAAEATQ